ncbi:MAG: pyridoxamine 5'-phosphate oxidase family protein [Actinomycetota bacterium]|nr:pyridoxamine 5'-phosphate oxidase family protein [Actinomycetota bacterium]
MSERIPTSWAEVALRLEQARSYWIVTRRPDGRPHAAPVWGVWLDGRVCFSTSPSSVKARNLAADPRVTVHLESADNVVILDGTAEPVDGDYLGRADAAYASKYVIPRTGERCGLGEGPAWAVTPALGHSWAEIAFPETMTRWRFGAAGAEPTSEENVYG